MSRRPGWTRQMKWSLEGSFVELHRLDGEEWSVVDSRQPDVLLAGPYGKINRAKLAAERALRKDARLGKVAP